MGNPSPHECQLLLLALADHNSFACWREHKLFQKRADKVISREKRSKDKINEDKRSKTLLVQIKIKIEIEIEIEIKNG